MDELKVVGTVPADSAELKVKVREAEVSIVREEREDIELRANNFDNWSVNGALIEQTAVAETGISMSISNISIDGDCVISGMSFVGGGSISQMIVNGKRVEIKGKEVFVDGKKQQDAPQTTLTKIAYNIAKLVGSFNRINGIEFGVHDGSVFINGKLQMDAEENAEGEEATEEAAPPPPQPDKAVIAVPHSFRGSLNLEHKGMQPIALDGWTGGDVTINASGNGDGTVTGPVSEVGTLSVRIGSMGGFDFEGPIHCGKAETTLSGNGNLSLAALNAGGLTARVKSMGKLTVDGELAIDGAADLGLSGNGGLKLRQGLTAQSLELSVSSMGGFTAEGPVVISGDAELTLSGNGAGKLESGIRAASLTMAARSMGGFKVGGPVNVAGEANVTLSGNGGANFDEAVEAAKFTGRVTSMGGITADEIHAGELNLSTTGMGSVKVDGGSCSSGTLRCSGMGGIKLRGDFQNLKQSRSGMGDIKVRND